MTKPMTRDQARNLTVARSYGESTYFKIWMPYLFQRVDYLGIKHVYLPLNRNYKPLGETQYAKYGEFVETHGVRLPRTAETYGDVWFNPQPETGRFWLYDDSAASRFDYFDRLQALLCKGVPLIDPNSTRVRRAKLDAKTREIRAARKAASSMPAGA